MAQYFGMFCSQVVLKFLGCAPAVRQFSMGTLAVFQSAFLAFPTRRRGLGKRTAFESSYPDSPVEADDVLGLNVRV